MPDDVSMRQLRRRVGCLTKVLGSDDYNDEPDQRGGVLWGVSAKTKMLGCSPCSGHYPCVKSCALI